MGILSDTWVLWLIITALLIGGLIFHRNDKGGGRMGGLYTSVDDFSVRTILFGFKKGEGDLFLGYTFAIFSFGLFLAVFIRWIRTLV